jgi:NAD-dependent DNA ligase
MINLIEQASKAYYDGNPILTNEQFDVLERMHGQTLLGNGDTPHAFPMYSLKKCYEDENRPLKTADCVVSAKLDGAAVSLLYVEGILTLALTRGDGTKGRDITEKMAQIVPEQIYTDEKLLQICGEVICDANMSNARNFCSGALNLKSIEEFKAKVDEGNIDFVAYSVQNRQSYVGIKPTYTEDLEFLMTLNFLTILDVDESNNVLTDGVVYRLDCNDTFNEMGFTSKFPRGAYAFKTNAEEVHTTLLDVIWQTGKSGKVTPVAILEPVQIGDAMVSRATLNNIEFIKALDLEIGCTVGVIRSGEIIPCIISRVK